MNSRNYLALCLVGVFALSAAAGVVAESNIVGGPYVVGVTSQTATIAWIVRSNEVTVRSAAAAKPVIAPVFRVEKTTLTGLKPNTPYDYDIAASGDGGKGSFKTPPFGPTGPFRFVVYGDNRTRPDVHRNVMAQLMKHGIPDFVVQT